MLKFGDFVLVLVLVLVSCFKKLLPQLYPFSLCQVNFDTFLKKSYQRLGFSSKDVVVAVAFGHGVVQVDDSP